MADVPSRQRTAINRVLLRDGDGPDTDERVVGAAFAAIVARLAADAPVLLAIDDAHWLDAASRAVLGSPRRDWTDGSRCCSLRVSATTSPRMCCRGRDSVTPKPPRG